jgi:general nucleoside transport system permease protein
MVQVDLVISTALSTMVPVLLAALGETISELAGIYNIGIEGIMLMGAVTSSVVTIATGNLIIGLIAGIFVGAIIGLAFSIFAIKLRSDLILLGLGFYLFGVYLSSFIGDEFYRTTTAIIYSHFGSVGLPFQSPVLSIIFGQQNVLFYVAIILVPVVGFLVYNTGFGLEIRASGEDPRSADSLGVNVFRVRYICVIIGACLMAFGGAYLVVGASGRFVDNMTSGRGFIALALVWVSKWKPHWVLLVSFVFALLDSASLLLQLGQALFPYEFLQMLPYIAGVVALAVSAKVKSWQAPRALGQPYSRESG